ncbi:hypothetical protein OIU84_004279, partial [Salix udensis]
MEFLEDSTPNTKVSVTVPSSPNTPSSKPLSPHQILVLHTPPPPPLATITPPPPPIKTDFVDDYFKKLPPGYRFCPFDGELCITWRIRSTGYLCRGTRLSMLHSMNSILSILQTDTSWKRSPPTRIRVRMGRSRGGRGGGGRGGGEDTELHDAARSGDMKAVESIVSSNPLAINSRDKHSRTP